MPFHKDQFRPSERETPPNLGSYGRGYLPHLDVPHREQFITIRLADSMPANLLVQWREERRHLSESVRKNEEWTRIQNYLDSGAGRCALAEPINAKIAEDSILFGHDKSYELKSWAVMPNHVHVVVHFLPGISMPAWIESFKKYTSRRINAQIGKTGQLWFREFFDRWMRSEEHEAWTINYVENNPLKAGIVDDPAQFAFSSARFRDSDGNLRLPQTTEFS